MRLFFYSAPTYQLVLQAVEMAKTKFNLPTFHLQGRHGEMGDDIPATCYRMPEVDELVAKGFKPGLVLCPYCEHNESDGCPYMSQFKLLPKTGVIFTTTKQAAGVISKVDPDVWIIDENPVSALINEEKTDLGDIATVKRRLNQRSCEIIDSIQKAGETALKEIKGNHQHARLYATAPPPGAWENTADLWDITGLSELEREALSSALAYLSPFEHENKRHWVKRLLDANINFHALRWLWTAAGDIQGATAYLRVQRDPNKPIQFVLFQRAILEYEGRMVILDGTANVKALKSLLGRNFNVVHAMVSPPNTKKVFIKRGLGKIKAKGLNQKQIKDRIKECIPHLKPTDKSVLLATHKDIEEKALEIARQCDSSRTWASVHFWAARGINAFEDHHAIICLGTPSVNPWSVLDITMVLFNNQEDRDAYVISEGEDDLFQTIHRIRPIKGGKTIIVMGRTWPRRLGRPTVFDDQQFKGGKMVDALNRLKPFVERFGFITVEIAAILGVGHTENIHIIKGFQAYLHEIKAKSQRVPSLLIDILNTDSTRYEGTFSPVVFGNRHAWQKILTALENQFSGIGKLECRLNGFRTVWAKGLGNLEDVRRFYELSGRPFQPEFWRQLEPSIVNRSFDFDVSQTTIESIPIKTDISSSPLEIAEYHGLEEVNNR